MEKNSEKWLRNPKDGKQTFKLAFAMLLPKVTNTLKGALLAENSQI